MPTTKIYIEDIYLQGITLGDFEERIPYIGAEIDDVEEDNIKIEYTPNRPDYGFPTGIFKSLKGLLDIETGLIEYTAKDTGEFKIICGDCAIEKRPIIRGVVIKNLKLNERYVEYIINFQEDIHKSLGRNRRKVSIGIHDMRRLKFPIKYICVDEKTSFIPLGYEEEMTISDILLKHPKGKEYGHLLGDSKTYPVLVDDNNKIISLPPIINSTITTVSEETKNIFIDVTGTDERTVEQVVDLLATSFSDIGGEIYTVHSIYKEGEYKTPSLKYGQIVVNHEYVEKILGMTLHSEEIINALRRARFNVELDKHKYNVHIPPYRFDIMHPIDIVEDIAIGYGLWKIEPDLRNMYFSMGKRDPFNEFVDKVREITIGMGAQEVVNHILTNKDLQEQIYFYRYNVITLSKVKTHRNSVRRYLIPGILETLKSNETAEHPIIVFEIGKVAFSTNGKIYEQTNLALSYSDYKATYSDIKAYFDTLIEILGLNDYIRIAESEEPFLLNGRRGDIYADNNKLGFIGEVNPFILEFMGIQFPICIFEINLDTLFNVYQEKTK